MDFYITVDDGHPPLPPIMHSNIVTFRIYLSITVLFRLIPVKFRLILNKFRLIHVPHSVTVAAQWTHTSNGTL